MRLLVVYQHAPTPGAPGIYRHRMLLAQLVKRGWHVDLISSPINYMDGTVPDAYTGRWRVREEIDGIHHHWVRAAGQVHRSMRHRASNYVTFAAHAGACGMRLPRPDLVWASSPPLSVASAGRAIARRHRVPLVLEIRDLWPESAEAAGLLNGDSRTYRTIDRLARKYASQADLAIVPTPGLVDLVQGHGADRVELVTGAIEDRAPDALVRARVRKQHGIPENACLFAYAGAHGIVNGLDILLDAAEQLTGREDVRILTAGAGSAHAALTRRLSASPIPGLQMLGPLPKAGARDLLAAADVGLHVLRPDPLFASALPTKVLEYLGCHLPFITTVPGLPAEVARATGGDLAESADDLAGAMTRWADRSLADRRRLGDAAFSWGDANYGLTTSVDRLESALHATAERASNQRS